MYKLLIYWQFYEIYLMLGTKLCFVSTGKKKLYCSFVSLLE